MWRIGTPRHVWFQFSNIFVPDRGPLYLIYYRTFVMRFSLAPWGNSYHQQDIKTLSGIATLVLDKYWKYHFAISSCIALPQDVMLNASLNPVPDFWYLWSIRWPWWKFEATEIVLLVWSSGVIIFWHNRHNGTFPKEFWLRMITRQIIFARIFDSLCIAACK